MSRERARRRQVREAEAARRTAAQRVQTGRAVARAARRRDWARRWRRLRSGVRLGGYSRRSRTQRGTVAAVVVGALVVIWVLADDWGVRVGLSLAVLIAAPALVTLALDRSNR